LRRGGEEREEGARGGKEREEKKRRIAGKSESMPLSPFSFPSSPSSSPFLSLSQTR
jgi:hypothetical protein